MAAVKPARGRSKHQLQHVGKGGRTFEPDVCPGSSYGYIATAFRRSGAASWPMPLGPKAICNQMLSQTATATKEKLCCHSVTSALKSHKLCTWKLCKTLDRTSLQKLVQRV